MAGCNYLAYWKWEGLEFLRHCQYEARYLGSKQLKKLGVEPGDTLWITTMQGDRWCLIAPLFVAELALPERAASILGISPLYPAPEYAIARTPAKVSNRTIPSDIAEMLRFASENDRLTLVGGKIDPKQLQAMRRLTTESANLLHELWLNSSQN